MFKQFAVHIFFLLFFLSLGGGFYFFDKYNKSLIDKKEEMVQQQLQLTNQIDKLLKGKSISKLNDSYKLLQEYFDKRKKILTLEMWIFLEYIYPEDNFVKSLDIDKKGKKINLTFYSTNLENIRRLYENLNFLKNKGIITEYSLKDIKLSKKVSVKNGNKQIYKYYNLQFLFNPDYSLVREFIIQKNDKLKIPFKKYYLLFDNDIKGLVKN